MANLLIQVSVTFTVLTLASTLLAANEPPVTSGLPADVAWGRLVEDPLKAYESVDGVSSYHEAVAKWGVNSEGFWSWWARERQQKRELGLKFREQFPDDPRRFKWLFLTVEFAPFYWQDVRQGARAYANKTKALALIDEQAQAGWEKQYLALRAEYMSAAEVDEEQRASLRYSELRVGLSKVDSPQTLIRAAHDVLDLAAWAPATLDTSIMSLADWVLQRIPTDAELELGFIAAMKLSPRTALRLFATGREQVAKLRGKPLELQLQTLDGNTVDLAALRGKAVLVDIWSNYCSSCIAAMPKIRNVYDQYRDRGFEVVGIWLDSDALMAEGQRDKNSRSKARSILKKQEVNWPNGIVAGADLERFQNHYAILGVPVTWLLDQKGMLVTTDVSGQKLESEVRRLIDSLQ